MTSERWGRARARPGWDAAAEAAGHSDWVFTGKIKFCNTGSLVLNPRSTQQMEHLSHVVLFTSNRWNIFQQNTLRVFLTFQSFECESSYTTLEKLFQSEFSTVAKFSIDKVVNTTSHLPDTFRPQWRSCGWVTTSTTKLISKSSTKEWRRTFPLSNDLQLGSTLILPNPDLYLLRNRSTKPDVFTKSTYSAVNPLFAASNWKLWLFSFMLKI